MHDLATWIYALVALATLVGAIARGFTRLEVRLSRMEDKQDQQNSAFAEHKAEDRRAFERIDTRLTALEAVAGHPNHPNHRRQ